MTASRGKIISVEDSETDFMALQLALEASGVDADIERYANGSVAMGEFGASCPLASKASLILLDLNLPGVDGRQLLKTFRDRDPQGEVPVIVLSTSSHPRDIEYCCRVGANAYVVKPLELDDWERKIGPLAKYWLRSALQRQSAKVDQSSALTLDKQGFAQGDDHLEKLIRAIESEVIPRLLLAHGGETARSLKEAFARQRTSDEVTELARLALRQDVGSTIALIESVRERGVTLEMIFQSHIAPAARLVGDFWKADMCSFSDFERAFSCLRDILVELSPSGTADETLH
jgi:CheY-like chemotaxis protein